MQGLTRGEQKTLTNVLEVAYGRRGFCTDAVVIRGYSIMFRHSRPWWPVVGENGKKHWYETLDIVQIGYEKYIHGWCEVEDIPKGGFRFLLDALQRHCIEKNIALKIECVYEEKVRKHFINTHGFQPEALGEYDTSVIKTLYATPKKVDE